MPYIWRERHQHVVDLVGQLTGRSEHQAARVRQEIVGAPLLGMPLAHLFHLMAELAHVLVLVGVDLTQSRDQRNRERQGLAGAGYGLGRECHDRPGNREGCRPGSGKRSSCHRGEHAYQRAGNASSANVWGRSSSSPASSKSAARASSFSITAGIGHNGLSCQTLRTLRKPVNSSPCPILLPWL